MTSYHVFERLMDMLPVEDHGIRMRLANFFFDRPLENLPDQYQKMKEIEHCGVSQFKCRCGLHRLLTRFAGCRLQARP